MNKVLKLIAILPLCIHLAGCTSGVKSEGSNTNIGPDPLFANGIWFRKMDVDMVTSGRVDGNFTWQSDWYAFETKRNEKGLPEITCHTSDIYGTLLKCGNEWCLDGDQILQFEILDGDTLAYFSGDLGVEDEDAPFIRLSPPNLDINDYPDWMFRKYYFARTYSCEYPRIDSTFELTLDEDGKVIGSDKYQRYEFHNEHDFPLFVFYGYSGQPYYYAFTTYSGIKNSFTVHEVLNQEALMDGQGATVELGGFMYSFDGN